MKISTAIVCVSLALAACSKDEDKNNAAASASATKSAEPPPSAAPVASAAPSASAAPLANSPKCPKGSEGPGTFDKPCAAKGAQRMMEALWNGKYDDKGAPQFKVTNKSPQTILYGRIAVYFYDKTGKQLDVKDSEGKTKPYQPCGGNIFSGVMKAGEKAVISFSCVKKENVPEGVAAIEGEMQSVGFADASGDKNDLYWKNDDLVPDQRKKGGIK